MLLRRTRLKDSHDLLSTCRYRSKAAKIFQSLHIRYRRRDLPLSFDFLPHIIAFDVDSLLSAMFHVFGSVTVNSTVSRGSWRVLSTWMWMRSSSRREENITSEALGSHTPDEARTSSLATPQREPLSSQGAVKLAKGKELESTGLTYWPKCRESDRTVVLS